MNCEQVEELLSAYLDNMLAPEERRQVAAHLQTCRSCTQALADFRRNDALLALAGAPVDARGLRALNRGCDVGAVDAGRQAVDAACDH